MNLRRRKKIVFQTGLFYVMTIMPSSQGSGPVLSEVLHLKYIGTWGVYRREPRVLNCLPEHSLEGLTECVADTHPSGFCSVCSPCS